MKYIRSIAKYLSVFGAGAITAGFFLFGPVDRPEQHPPTTTVNGGWVLVPPTTSLAWTDATSSQPTPDALQQPPVPVTDQPSAETTGSSAPQSTAADNPNLGQIEMTPRRDAACNVTVCRRFYRSFDEATCTYRPYGGGAPQLCNR